MIVSAIALSMNRSYIISHIRAPDRLEDQQVHRIHLSHGIMQIENLCNLMSIKKDRVKFFAVPLKLKTEASPVRAFAIED